MTRIVTRLCSAIALFAILAAVPPAAPAAEAKPIDSLLPMLDKLGWHYELVNDHTALVEVPLDGDVKVPVYVAVEKDEHGNDVFGSAVLLIKYPGAVPTNVESKMNELNGPNGNGLQYGKLTVIQNKDGSSTVAFFSWTHPMSKANSLEVGLKIWAKTAKDAYEQLPKA